MNDPGEKLKNGTAQSGQPEDVSSGGSDVPRQTGGSLDPSQSKNSENVIGLLLSRPFAGPSTLMLYLVAIFLVLLLVFVGALEVLSFEGLTPQAATIGGTTVVFFPDRNQPEGKKAVDYVVVIQPQAWQQTPIEVRNGDKIEVEAARNVTVDMWGINNYSQVRANIDALIERKYPQTRNADGDSPERHYDDKEFRKSIEGLFADAAHGSIVGTYKNTDQTDIDAGSLMDERIRIEDALRPLRGWTGPDGYQTVPQRDTAVRDRQKRKILKDEHYGSLLGAFYQPADGSCTFEKISRFTPGCVPSRNSDEKFLIGACLKDKIVRASGWNDDKPRKLWLIVNDVWDDPDPIFPEKFYVDNLGVFYARVRVIPEKITNKYTSNLGCQSK